jgi:hypothetical protein
MAGDDPSKNQASESAPGGGRRRVPRHNFVATAEILDLTTQARVTARISEISLKGCYLDVLNPLPTETVIGLRIERDSGSFRTSARVIYVHPGIGMGVAFQDTDPGQGEILQKWLTEIETA